MANVLDVATYILNKCGSMSTMKLQKLVYYTQAWSLVWDENELFPEEFEAWANGPVCRELYENHRGRYRLEVGDIQGNKQGISGEQQESIDTVLKEYCDKSPQWLSVLTHQEDPWKNARAGILDGCRGEVIVTKDAMLEYYGSL